MATITLRLSKQDKTAVEKLADALGMSVSSLYGAYTKKLLRHRGVPFEVSLNDDTAEGELTPNVETQRIINDAMTGKNLSRRFSSVDDLMDDLNADD